MTPAILAVLGLLIAIGLAIYSGVILFRRNESPHGWASYAAMAVGVIWGGTVVLNIPRHHRPMDVTVCISHLKQNALALVMYAGDSDGRLPQQRWWTSTLPYRKNDELVCGLVKTGVGYGINDRLLGTLNRDGDSQTVLLAETINHLPDATAHSELDLERRHSRNRINVVHTDASARTVTSGREQWAPGESVDWSKVKSSPGQPPDPELEVKLWQSQLTLLAGAWLLAFLAGLIGTWWGPAHRRVFWGKVLFATALGLVAFVFVPIYI